MGDFENNLHVHVCVVKVHAVATNLEKEEELNTIYMYVDDKKYLWHVYI